MPPILAPPRLPPKIRKFESGAEKRRKKKKIAELIESQTGAHDKFIAEKYVLFLSLASFHSQGRPCTHLSTENTLLDPFQTFKQKLSRN
jgi:hypothetical protein